MFRGARRVLIPALALFVVLAFPFSVGAIGHLRGSWTAVSVLPDDVTISTAVGGKDGLVYVFGVCQGVCIQTNGIVHSGAPVTRSNRKTSGLSGGPGCFGWLARKVT